MSAPNIDSGSLRFLSPFRYPGGKSWLQGHVGNWIRALPKMPALFIEPFAGGGSISLSIARTGSVKRVIMVERDPDVAAVWKTILGRDYLDLKRRILAFRMTRAAVTRELNMDDDDKVSVAFKCLLRNRVQRGGILAPGAGLLRRGERGNGLSSRWYPETLARRIDAIRSLKRDIQFIEGDGFAVLDQYAHRDDVAYFVDPPYVANGKGPGTRLYRFSEVDHSLLFQRFSQVAGQFLITYHDTHEIRSRASLYGFDIGRLQMITAHHRRHTELLLTKRLPCLAASAATDKVALAV